MTKQITVGKVKIGGGVPVSIQSMLNTKTTDVEGSLRQIRELAAAGCEIARLAVPDMQAAEAFGKICEASPLPLVADIHFDYRLAIKAKRCGQNPHQPRKYWGRKPGKSRRRLLQGAPYSDPHRRERRQFGERPS